MNAREVSEKIEEAFSQLSGDGAFLAADRSAPYQFLSPHSEIANAIVVARKSNVILNAMKSPWLKDRPGFIGRASLPHRSDFVWSHSFLLEYRLFFLGDLSPADLMYFAWIRANCKCAALKYLGISDHYLGEIGIKFSDSITHAMTAAERGAMAVLEEVFPDWQVQTGRNCADVMLASLRIDLDGITARLKSIDALVNQDFFEGQ